MDADDLWLPDDPGTGGGPALFGALLACLVIASFATLIASTVVSALFPETASWPRQVVVPVVVALPVLTTLGLWLRDRHVRARAEREADAFLDAALNSDEQGRPLASNPSTGAKWIDV